MKIEYQQREKIKNYAVLFPLTTANLAQMIYACKLINKRYKRCDYVGAYTSSSVSKNLEKTFNVLVKLSGEDSFINIVKSFIKSCSYRRVMIICEDVIYEATNGLVIRLPVEMPRKGMWFDLFNVNISLLTPSQRKSANRAYQTCRHTTMYIDIGKEKSKTRERIIKRYDKIGDTLDNFLILKQKINNLECKNEKVEGLDVIYKKYKKLIDEKIFPELNMVKFSKSTLKSGSYGLELSKQRDYSIVDKRIEEQLKAAKKKISDKNNKKR